jgi:hypothetical protein
VADGTVHSEVRLLLTRCLLRYARSPYGASEVALLASLRRSRSPKGGHGWFRSKEAAHWIDRTMDA